jgi:hypothetical protein
MLSLIAIPAMYMDLQTNLQMMYPIAKMVSDV